MYCQRCGAESAQSVCALCAGDSPLAERPNRIADRHPEGQTPNLFAAGYEQEPRGVGGWLAFFCLTLTLFGPLTNLRIAIKALINLAEHPIGLPTEFRLASVEVVYAGLSGVQRPRGLSLVAGRAQRSGICQELFDHFNDLRGHSSRDPLLARNPRGLVDGLIGRLGYCVIWYSYLQCSRRVQATYAVS